MPTLSAPDAPLAAARDADAVTAGGLLPAVAWAPATQLLSAAGSLARHLPWLRCLPIGRFLRAQCGPPWERLRRAQSELETEDARTEKEFLAFGDGLRSLSSHCDEILTRRERLLALATGQEAGGDAIDAVRELLDYPLRFVADFAFDAAGLLGSAERTRMALERVLETEAELSRALDPLIYLRTLFHIESARLTSEMFGSMDEEIESLQNALRTQFVAKFAELRAMRRALVQFTGEYAGRTRILAARVESKRAVLASSFEQMDASVAASGRLQQGILHATTGLGADVNSMVFSLQAHDIVMQRLGHVRRGLDVLGDLLQRLENGNLGAGRGELAKLSTIAHLEGAQVHSACAQLSDASRSLLANVEGVVRGISQFDDDCLMMREYGQATAGVSGTVQILLDSIEDTRALVREAAAAAKACSEPLEPLSALVASVSHDMAHTGEYMRRLALNFQLSAARYGAGTGLEVLAARMASASSEVSRICAAADREVAVLAVDLRTTLEGFAGIVADSLRMTDLFSGHESEGLHELRNATLTAFQEVSEILEIARQTAAGMQAVNLTRLCGEILPEIENAAEEISVRTRGLARTVRARPLDAAELRALSDQYTMHSERVVHAAAVGSPAGDAVPDAMAGSNEPAVPDALGHSDLGANVELF